MDHGQIFTREEQSINNDIIYLDKFRHTGRR